MEEHIGIEFYIKIYYIDEWIKWRDRAIRAETKVLCFRNILRRKESEPWNGPLSTTEKSILVCCNDESAAEK